MLCAVPYLLQDLLEHKDYCKNSLCGSQILFSNVPLPSSLIVRLKSVIPLQLIHSHRSSFFTSYTIEPVLKSSGIFLDIQISWKLFSRMVDSRDALACNSSGLMSTTPGFRPSHPFDGLDILDYLFPLA